MRKGETRRQIKIDRCADFADNFIRRSGLFGDLVLNRYQYHQFVPREFANRLVVTLTIEPGAPLITYDDGIEQFAKRYGEQYYFMVIA